MANENRLKANTPVLAGLRRGWALTSPDGDIKIWADKNEITVWFYAKGTKYHYPLTSDGFEAMMNEAVNSPF